MFKAEHIIHEEHHHLCMVIRCIRESLRTNLETDTPLDIALVTQAFDYVDRFFNTVHHPKESVHLFPLLRQRRPDMVATVDRLEAQHKKLPNFLSRARAGLERFNQTPKRGRQAFVQLLEAFCEFELNHMREEEKVVLPAAHESLTEDDWRALGAVFGDNQDPLSGDARRAEFEALYLALVERLPVPQEQQGESTKI